MGIWAYGIWSNGHMSKRKGTLTRRSGEVGGLLRTYYGETVHGPWPLTFYGPWPLTFHGPWPLTFHGPWPMVYQSLTQTAWPTLGIIEWYRISIWGR